jgi:HAD superfamily hydrolase (TIGR01509 family)
MSDLENKKQILEALPKGAYVFDNDGVLADTEGKWFEVYMRLLAPYHVVHDLVVHSKMMGQTDRACVLTLQKLHPELPQGEDATEELLLQRGLLIQEIKAESPIAPMPGAVDLVNKAKQQKIPVAMATGTSRVDIDDQIKLLDWDKLFNTVVSGDDIEHSKPAPDIYLEAARRLGVKPEDCVAFEDSISGLTSAHAAGMKTVFVRDPRFQLDAPFEPSLTIASFTELL